VASRIGDRLWAGAAGTYLRRDYNVSAIPGASSDPVFAGGSSKGAMGVDAGVLMKAADHVYLGASGQNLNRPDLGLVGTDKVPMTWRTGAALRGEKLSLMGEVKGANGDVGKTSKWGLGLEWKVASPLVLRAGGDDQQFSAGMGLSFRDMRLDYAFSFLEGAAAGAGSGTHRMALNIKFGSMRGEEEEAPKPRKVVAKRQAYRRAVKAKASSSQASGESSVSSSDDRAYPSQQAAPVYKRRIRALD
jgi:hypothetical protein